MHRPQIQKLLPLALCAAPFLGCVGVPDYHDSSASRSWSGSRGSSGDWRADSYTSRASTHSSRGWDGRPASWAKLIEIEDWLNEPSYRRDESSVGEAELQLAEGRLILSRREMGQLDARLLTLRLNASEAGFQRALARNLDASQRRRAENGMGELKLLREGRLGGQGLNPAGLEILTRDRWGAKPVVAARLTRNRQAWNRITVHHSAEHTRDLGRQSTLEVANALRRIQLFHMRDGGFGDVGYHFLIDPRGRIWQGRHLVWQGAHSEGPNNVANIGICLLGNYDLERATREALVALEKLVNALAQRHHIQRSQVFGHDHWKPTECPGTHLNAWLKAYKKRAARPRKAQ